MEQGSPKQRYVSAHLDTAIAHEPILQTHIQQEYDQPAAKDALQSGEKLGARPDHSQGITDTGWNVAEAQRQQTLIDGLDNEDIWLLVRRFNKVRAAVPFMMNLTDPTVIANIPS